MYGIGLVCGSTRTMRGCDSAYMERSVVAGQGDAGFGWRPPGCCQVWPSETPRDSWTHQMPGDKHDQDTGVTEEARLSTQNALKDGNRKCNFIFFLQFLTDG